PYQQMPSIYASADVLVKASNAEGMFGPPMEMFATGGTAVAWHVQGAEEYMSDRFNSYLVPINSWTCLWRSIRELADNPDRVRFLQQNAFATIEAWPTWEDQSEAIVATIESLVPFGRSSLVRQVARNQFRCVFQNPPLAGTTPTSVVADHSFQAEAQANESVCVTPTGPGSSRQRVDKGLMPVRSPYWGHLLAASRRIGHAARRLVSSRTE